MTNWAHGMMVFALIATKSIAISTSTIPTRTVPIPPWRTHLMPWEWHSGLPAPWRSDPRLAGRFAPGYDDDVQIVFLNPDSAAGKKHELMWVRVTAHDSASDEYLGILQYRSRSGSASNDATARSNCVCCM
jgi:hypothetical protein